VSRNQVGHPHGEQILKVAMDEIRALGILPRDVEVLGFVSPIEANNNACWIPEARHFLYVHIKSTISFDRPENSPLCIERLFEFYDRYIAIRRDWANKLESDMARLTQLGTIP
jgi:hypothetical protein